MSYFLRNTAAASEESKVPVKELTIAYNRLLHETDEREKRAAELVVANAALAYQIREKGKRAAELILANKELAYQNKEKEKRADELIIANKELAYQNTEKEKRAAELIIANKELAYQNEEKGKRAAELAIANEELAYQNAEKENRAAELIIANVELMYQNEEKEKCAAQLVLANKHLIYENEEKEMRATELAAALLDVQKKKTEIRVLNEDLEKKVIKRTEELELANRELETFSYSVSHDLRAPINAVLGFTGIIQQEYGDRMEPEIRELFDFIQQSGKRMSIIIDDLLRLAKCSKEELRCELIDMNQLVKGVWAQLCILHPHKATLKIADLPPVSADKSMMEQVIMNLISNAIKYSAKKKKSVISIWSEIKDSETVFFFRDNGVGFDMSNYGRLFGAFQRLHGMSEFEGIGVGLTLVKRIIEKHGGTVGAESAVGEGATFYISLPA